VSAIGEAFTALKNVLLLHERLDRVQKDVERLSADVLGLNRYAVEIDKRVSRIEGVMEGVARASSKRPRRLPKT
jgi:hypothetical protein